MQNTNDTLTYAQKYVSKGFSVIPIRKGDKKPALSSWKKYQTRRPTEVELVDWFLSGENNIAIVTGEISGIAVLDFDSVESFERAKAMGLTDTPIVKTGKVYHAYYCYQAGIRNSQGNPDIKNIDVRGEGGYIIAPPSVHPSGAVYTWVDGHNLDDKPLTGFPEKLIKPQKSDVPEPASSDNIFCGVEKGIRNQSLA